MALRDEEFVAKIKTLSFTGHRMRNHGQFQRDREKYNQSELDAYADCVREGTQPDGTMRHHTEMAKRVSDELGVAYRGDDLTGTAVRAGIIPEPQPLTADQKREAREAATKRLGLE